jgi:AP-3 complex subunit mu
LEDVVVIIPFSKFLRTANLKVSTGTVLFDEASKVAKWNVGKLSGDKYPSLNGTLLLVPYNPNAVAASTSMSSTTNTSGHTTLASHLSSNSNSGSGSNSNYTEVLIAPVIEIQWKVPMASISGLAVSSLQLTNERYKPYKGVRTVAKSGKFLIRSSG